MKSFAIGLSVMLGLFLLMVLLGKWFFILALVGLGCLLMYLIGEVIRMAWEDFNE